MDVDGWIPDTSGEALIGLISQRMQYFSVAVIFLFISTTCSRSSASLTQFLP
jgi:hypothetical protein